MQVNFGSLAIRDLCRYLLVEFGLAVMVPGLLSVCAPVTLTTAVMATQGALLGVLEEQLYGTWGRTCCMVNNNSKQFGQQIPNMNSPLVCIGTNPTFPSGTCSLLCYSLFMLVLYEKN